MHVNLRIKTSQEYFLKTDREIDWEEDDDTKISYNQSLAVEKILATEVSIYLLRRSTGVCGSLIDVMRGIHTELIRQYEKEYELYTVYNDFD